LPVPDRIGPYVVDRVLGKGGMGIVYEARHSITGASCAVKTVGNLDAKLLGMLRREIRALSRLRHPGIVSVLEEGIEDGCPWYAMELLEGLTLASIYASSWRTAAARLPTRLGQESGATVSRLRPAGSDSAETWAEASAAGGGSVTRNAAVKRSPESARVRELLSTLKELCAPLAFLHGEGLVHCDLKPSNVFLRPDGSPVIGDFGLVSNVAGAYGRDVLDVLGGIRGSVAYMAPEQVQGEPLDARADLYALGCMLYEAVTGRPPFLGPSRDMLAAHLSERPTPPSRLVAGVPEGLEAIILRLLTKQPRRRIGFADDVATMLAPFCLPGPEPVDFPRPRPYLYRSQLVGRDRDLDRLGSRLGEAEGGKGGCVFLGGESGVGKTRLATELGMKAGSMGVQVLTGQCAEPTAGTAGGAPLEVLAPLLRAVADRCREEGAQETARLLGERGAVLAAYERSLADVADVGDQPELARLEPAAARRRLFDALLETLKALTDEKTLLLILDDLQWCDELTLAFLSFLRGRVAGTRFLVLGTYRTEELGGELRELIQAPDAEHLALGRLREDTIGSMVIDMLAMDERPAGFVQFLTRESEGNPFFVAEYLRTAVAERVLYRNDLGRWQLASLYTVSEEAYESLPLPKSLRELVSLRLQGLSEDARRAVQMAAVLGRELEAPLLESAIDVEAERTMDGVQELVARQVLEHAPEGRLRFLHHRLREFSYDAIDRAERVELHRRAALAIEAAAESPQLAQHAELGRHWSLGERPERAVRHYRVAASKSAEIYANAQAIDYYRLALAELDRLGDAAEPDGAARQTIAAQLHEGLGNLLSLTGKQGEARESYGAAVELLGSRQAVHAATLHGRIGRTWETHHEHVNALAAYDLAAGELGAEPFEPAEPWWESWIELRLDRAWVHYWRGTAELMQTELDAVRPHLTSRGTPRLQARFFELMANLGYRKERYLLSEQTVEYARKAHLASVETADPLLIAESLFEMGFAQLFHGDVTSATDTLNRAWADARRIGDITRQARSLTYVTLCLRRARRTALVESHGRRSLEAAQESGIRVYVGTSQANLGWVDFHARRYPEAQERCRSALELWRGIDAAFPFFWMAVFPLLAMRLARGDLAELLGLVRSLLAPSQQRLPEELTAPLEDALAAGRGREERVRAALARAVKLAEETGYL